jgi:hypothetical protein
MQMLPFPGKRHLRGQIAGKEVDASKWDLEAVRRRVAADVKKLPTTITGTTTKRSELLRRTGTSSPSFRKLLKLVIVCGEQPRGSATGP